MFIRVEARDALKAAIENQTDVKVTKGWNAPDSADEEIFLGTATGNVTYDVFQGSVLPHDDQFTIDVLLHTQVPGRTQEQAEARVQEMANFVVASIADADFNDLHVYGSGMEGWVIYVTLADSEMPETNPVEEGYEAYGSVTVAVHTRAIYT